MIILKINGETLDIGVIQGIIEADESTEDYYVYTLDFICELIRQARAQTTGSHIKIEVL